MSGKEWKNYGVIVVLRFYFAFGGLKKKLRVSRNKNLVNWKEKKSKTEYTVNGEMLNLYMWNSNSNEQILKKKKEENPMSSILKTYLNKLIKNKNWLNNWLHY